MTKQIFNPLLSKGFQEISTGTENDIINVTAAADLPAVLLADTTYIINGQISTSQAITSVGENSAIIGRSNRDSDKLTYTGLGTFITITDVNFALRNLTLTSNTINTNILTATNYSAGGFNDGRLKTLSIFTCQFRNCFDILDVNGYDLVDINNTLFFYCTPTNFGCRFQSTSKLEFSSCELIRWFDETTIPAPSGFGTTSMIELSANGAQSGFGAINISSCILHPQVTQYGINISDLSTTGFGTISANTFINVGLTTGVVDLVDYDIQNSFIVQANQGIKNQNSKGTLSIVGNLNDLDTGTTNPQVLNEINVGGSFTNAPTFPVTNRVITSGPDCSFTYNNKNDGNFFVVVTGTVEMTGDGFIACRVRANGVAIPFAIGYPEIRQGRAQSFTFSVIGSAVVGDVFDVEFEALTTAGVPQLNDILVREFVLNGYQF